MLKGYYVFSSSDLKESVLTSTATYVLTIIKVTSVTKKLMSVYKSVEDIIGTKTLYYLKFLIYIDVHI